MEPADRRLFPVTAGERHQLLQRIQPRPKGEGSLSDHLHVLRVHGLGGRFSQEQFPTSRALLTVLTDESVGDSVFGFPAIVRTRYGVRFPTLVSYSSGRTKSLETHRDQCLAAMGELGIPLSRVLSVSGEERPLRDVLRDSVANFHLSQHELEWTALAYALYLPPVRQWVNRFGEDTSFDDLVDELLERPLYRSSCAGTHRLYTLTILARIDREEAPVLSQRCRDRLTRQLRRYVEIALAAQESDGSWDLAWHPDFANATAPGEWTPSSDTEMMRVLATGHIAEWMLYLPEDLQVSDEVLRRAGRWACEQLQSATAERIEQQFCPYSHCACVVRHLTFVTDASSGDLGRGRENPVEAEL